MPPPNIDVVNGLVTSLLENLTANCATVTTEELVSAVYTLAGHMTRTLVEVPGVNLPALRAAIATIYAIIPPEGVN